MKPHCVICGDPGIRVSPLVERDGGSGKVLVHSGLCADKLFDKVHPILCPQCHGSGQIEESRKVVGQLCCRGGKAAFGGHAGFAGCEYCPNIRDDIEVNYKRCDLCEGKCRLREQPEPITKIIGWRRKDSK